MSRIDRWSSAGLDLALMLWSVSWPVWGGGVASVVYSWTWTSSTVHIGWAQFTGLFLLYGLLEAPARARAAILGERGPMPDTLTQTERVVHGIVLGGFALITLAVASLASRWLP